MLFLLLLKKRVGWAFLGSEFADRDPILSVCPCFCRWHAITPKLLLLAPRNVVYRSQLTQMTQSSHVKHMHVVLQPLHLQLHAMQRLQLFCFHMEPWRFPQITELHNLLPGLTLTTGLSPTHYHVKVIVGLASTGTLSPTTQLVGVLGCQCLIGQPQHFQTGLLP